MWKRVWFSLSHLRDFPLQINIKLLNLTPKPELTMAESMPRLTETVLVAHGGWFFL